jgi:hypothetical protein
MNSNRILCFLIAGPLWTRLQFFQAVFISRLDLNTYWRFTGSELMGKSVRLDGDIKPAEG